MDSGAIQPYFIEQIVGLDWGSGVSRDDMADALGDYPAFQAIVIENLDEDATFETVDAVIVAIPDDAWQAAVSDLQSQGADLSGAGSDASSGTDAMGTASGGSSDSVSADSASMAGNQGSSMPPPGADIGTAEAADQPTAGA